MKIVWKFALAAGLAAAFVPPCLAQADMPSPHQAVLGTWSNPSGSVKVATGDCNGNLCGWVVWANPKAASDARAAGVTNLVGIALLQDYRLVDGGRWQGRVYVPDMGNTYFSRLSLLDANRLKISGCVLGGWICKSQIWRRV